MFMKVCAVCVLREAGVVGQGCAAVLSGGAGRGRASCCPDAVSTQLAARLALRHGVPAGGERACVLPARHVRGAGQVAG